MDSLEELNSSSIRITGNIVVVAGSWSQESGQVMNNSSRRD